MTDETTTCTCACEGIDEGQVCGEPAGGDVFCEHPEICCNCFDDCDDA